MFEANFSANLSEFRNNSAKGGGIMTMLVTIDDSLYFGDSIFSDNSADEGGVISGAQYITFNRCHILCNSANKRM